MTERPERCPIHETVLNARRMCLLCGHPEVETEVLEAEHGHAPVSEVKPADNLTPAEWKAVGEHLGDLVQKMEAAAQPPTAHQSVIYTDLTVRCHDCNSPMIWRYFEEKDEIEVFHSCTAQPSTGAQPASVSPSEEPE